MINSFIRFPADTILCLTVDIKNNDFEKAANLHIKYGFKNPYSEDNKNFDYKLCDNIKLISSYMAKELLKRILLSKNGL